MRPKKFADLCEANGQGDVLPNMASAAASARELGALQLRHAIAYKKSLAK
jgi:hypothetical protein